MGESLLTFYLDLSEDSKKKKMALKIDFYSRILFPLIFIVFSIVFKEFG
jgi:lipopolysaccharide export LptBFGC system permease protein LptF